MKQKHKLTQEYYMQGMKYKEPGKKYEVSINTIKSWRKKHASRPRKQVHLLVIILRCFLEIMIYIFI
ncbi:hypothetical protein BK708_26370 [Bacillus thuringiensis serovar yunnanensis]|nr:hypothetical protein BK708_26370 [Bacillus thuringiensis serovar yunnanensis]